MTHTLIGPRYLMRWDHSRDQRLDRDTLVTTHRLAELPIFSDDGLAELLDRCPRRALQVSTMGDNPAHPSQSQVGQLQHHSGSELIQMIRRGRLCIRLKNLTSHHLQLRRIVERLASEMMECQPGLRTSNHDGDLEISSPTALTYYRFDVRPNIFWQIRGSRTILAYPRREPFVHAPSMAQAISQGNQNPLYFEPAFDDHALRFAQTSGELLSLPQHTPYRVMNDQHLTVSLTTTYTTRQSRRRIETHRANHLLNRFLPRPNRSYESNGVRSAVKRVLLRVPGVRGVETVDDPAPTFCVDPNSPSCVGPLSSGTEASNPAVPTFPILGFESSTAPQAVLEN